MAIRFISGPNHVVDTDLQFAPVEVDGADATVYLRGVDCGDITITDGAAYLDDVTCGILTLAAGTNNRLNADNIRCEGLVLGGGSPGQEVVINGLHTNGGLVSMSTFEVWSITGAVFGDNTPGGVSRIDLDGLEHFTLKATILGSDEHGLRAEDCAVGDIDVHINDPSMATDNTYDGISLQGVCDRLNLRGSVRGAIRQTDNPRYGLDVAAGCLDIDVWLAISGAQTGEINDATSGQVTVH